LDFHAAALIVGLVAAADPGVVDPGVSETAVFGGNP